MIEPPLNEKFIEQLGLLEKLMIRKGEPMRANAYRKAKQSLIDFKSPITNIDEIKNLKNIGKTTIEKLTQYIETGEIDLLKSDEHNQELIDVFTKIYGVGPKNALKIVNSGIKTISELRKVQDKHLNDKQKIGLQYYEDINKRIPRREIDEYNDVFNRIFSDAQKRTNQSNAVFQIVGSYRREKEDSGDIDVIITNQNKNKSVFTEFIKLLIENNIILHKLTDGEKQIKILVICQLPGKPARRVDFMYSVFKEYPFSLLYFTGSQQFNTAMRQWALDMGYTMNEHRLENTKTNEIVENINTEKEIFDFLQLKYVAPKDRIDKNSLIKIKMIKRNKHELFSLAYKKYGKVYLDKQSIEQITVFMKKANIQYHSKGEPLLTDKEYDELRDYIEEKYPDAEILNDVGAPIEEHDKHKIVLPYEMPSLDKIKPSSSALSNWLSKYNDPSEYVLSVKLDGVSGLYDGINKKLYTRGNGKVGQDVSYLIPYLTLPKTSEAVIRGEFVISKSNFTQFNDKSNARNTVAGIINSKKVNNNEIKYVDFVGYEIIEPKLKPSEQFKLLTNIHKNHVCQFTYAVELTNEMLSESLILWRQQSKYDMDGIVVSHDKMYERSSGNPKHAFAFKMVLDEQKAEAVVLDVEWNTSKDGYLKPRVIIEPVNLGGVTISRTTGHNASFIYKNKINIGSVLEIIRSGDVIPYINKVKTYSDEPKMPDEQYVWTSTQVDIMLKSKENNKEVNDKQLELFFSDVERLGAGNIKKIVNAGFDSVPKIISMSKEDLLSIPGFQDKLATVVHTNIQNKIKELSLAELLTSSNCLGRGFGDKKINLILSEYPDIFTSSESIETKVNKLNSIKGFAQETSSRFVENIPNCLDFIRKANLNSLLVNLKPSPESPKNIDHQLYSKKIVFTGTRDKDVIKAVQSFGGIIEKGIQNDTFALVTSDINSTKKKMMDAKAKKIPVMTYDDFKSKFLTT